MPGKSWGWRDWWGQAEGNGELFVGDDRPDGGRFFNARPAGANLFPIKSMDLEDRHAARKRMEEGLVLVRSMGENFAYSMVES